MSEGHIPVLLGEVLDVIAPRDGAHYIDGTFGGGGYSRALLEAAECRVLGIDRDPDAIARGQEMVAHYDGRLTLVQGEFSNMDALLAAAGETGTDGVVLDVGVSSFQFDQPERGFSFREDGPLDMRMSRSGPLGRRYRQHGGRERNWPTSSSASARNGIRAASPAPSSRPGRSRARPQLAEIVSQAMGPAAGPPSDPSGHAHLPGAAHLCERRTRRTRARPRSRRARAARRRPARRRRLPFAGRSHRQALPGRAQRVPRPRARVMRPRPARAHAQTFRLITPRAVKPGTAEVERNPRARSARLRAAERLAPAA